MTMSVELEGSLVAIRKRRWPRALGQLVLFLVFSAAATQAQGASVTRVECKNWDENFLVAYNFGLIAAAVATFLLVLFSHHFFRNSWWSVRPWLRRWNWFGISLGLALTVWVGLPNWALGVFPYHEVLPDYALCTTKDFGATGLLHGLVFSGRAALALTPFLAAFIVMSALIGFSIALLLGWIKNRRWLARARSRRADG